ncbi:MAG TPA: methylenetetrahydrofolate--tRNA-(uracil(54)-C(5))-methyltransferase (FADH(2)-oxidizing) TrmFO [Fibrobacteres bacterium]|nr:methylenetetrahydrofolate--tRNA-(uracil(54)-C(5))-methyltransferase (FADH(2)-oxidizing) TrmFO [Fibrobacterota bacterium]
MPSVEIIGAGLAGCEAAIVLARNNVKVELVEMRPGKTTPAHKTGLPAELVCSNSLKSAELPSAQALLKKELDLLGSPLLKCAIASAVPAGSALAVDRNVFSRSVHDAILSNKNISLSCREALQPSKDHRFCIIAAGPLVSTGLADWLQTSFSTGALSFYDAIAPIVSLDSVNTDIAFYASRRQPESTDYLNCPFTEEEYARFYDALVCADLAIARDFENSKYFEACLPLEVIAGRGKLSLAFGPLKPIGFIDPRTGRMPYALCQLRRENNDGLGFGMVAFQTRLTISGQQKVFRLIPGLENAEFLRYGSCHRNTFMDSPVILSSDLSFKTQQELFLAGQLCGNEGYVESIATGHLAALFALARIKGDKIPAPPVTTACGALLRHITSSEIKPFTPSNFNFGLLPALELHLRRKPGKKEKHELLCNRAVNDFMQWMNS